jgi:hypothetical protein
MARHRAGAKAALAALPPGNHKSRQGTTPTTVLPTVAQGPPLLNCPGKPCRPHHHRCHHQRLPPTGGCLHPAALGIAQDGHHHRQHCRRSMVAHHCRHRRCRGPLPWLFMLPPLPSSLPLLPGTPLTALPSSHCCHGPCHCGLSQGARNGCGGAGHSNDHNHGDCSRRWSPRAPSSTMCINNNTPSEQ